MKIYVILCLMASSIIFGAESPRDVLKGFLKTYDSSMWDVKMSVKYALGKYLDSLNEEKRNKFLAIFNDKPKSGINAAMVEWFYKTTEIVEYKDENINGDIATVVVSLRDKKTGGIADVEYRLIKNEDGWKLYGNGTPGDDGSTIRDESEKIYRKLENDLGFDNLLIFARRTMIDKESPGDVLADLKRTR